MTTRGVVPILTYHSLDESGSVISMHPDIFARQMTCLAEMGWRATTISEAVEHLEEVGRWPEQTVVLTFDDGYQNLCQHAQPVLSQHGFRATVLLVTDHVGGDSSWAEPPAGLGVQRVLGWEQVHELAQAGWEIGAHTCTHPDLTKLTAGQLEHEIRGSRLEIEDRLGIAVTSFAYPFGRTSIAATSSVAKEFRAACTVDLRRATVEALHSLPRVDTYYVRDPETLQRLLPGSLDTYLTLRRWGRRVRATVLG